MRHYLGQIQPGQAVAAGDVCFAATFTIVKAVCGNASAQERESYRSACSGLAKRLSFSPLQISTLEAEQS
jgi:hypothetical protein